MGRFEAMTAEELAGNFTELEIPATPERALLTTEDLINGMKEISDRKLAWIQSTISAADARIAAFDKNLKGEVLAERAAAIRKETDDQIELAAAEIRKFAERAKAQEIFYTPQACQLRASFSTDPAMDAGIRLSWSNRLVKMSPPSIKTVAEFASATDNLALACCISEELEARDDLPEIDGKKPNRGTRDDIYKLIASVTNPSKKVFFTIHDIKMNAERVMSISSKTYSSVQRVALGLQNGHI